VANTLLTINMITREAVRLWRNSNSFIQHIDMQYDDSFARTGAKIGTALRIRYPNDFTVRTGATASVQDTNETNTTLVLATQQGVDVSYSSVDRTMALDDFSRRVIAPMVNNLTGAVAVNVIGAAEGGISNYVSNTLSGATISPTSQTWLQAGAKLDLNSTPRGLSRKVIMHPQTQANTVSSLSGLFNPAAKISEQYRSGQMASDTLGFDWFMDQTVIAHTNGSFNAVGGTVNLGGQTGTTVNLNAATGTLALGDIVTFDGVFAVNRITKQSTGQLQQFAITAAQPTTGFTSVSIYPAIIPPVGGSQVQYQTVTASPANGAQMRPVGFAGETYLKNFAFAPDAVTMATADLELPRGVHEAARESFDGVSLRMISAYDVKSDQFITRLDVLYGFLWVRPEWACVVADTIVIS
jgi:hypothetical protein